MVDMAAENKHFILVHGACHGAWCWYKVKPLLESAGHRVTVVDMAASGINDKKILELGSLKEYSEPLLQKMASLESNEDDEKVILVGHSLGGMNLAVAMEYYPHKIALAVFLTAFAPDTINKPSYVLDQFNEKTPMEAWLDTEFCSYGNADEPYLTTMRFGPKVLANKVYQLSPPEDLELAKTLMRTSSLFMEDLSKAKKFTRENYGKVAKVYVICDEDKLIKKEFQEWVIQNAEIQNVIQINGADHMPMFSKPHQLFQCLLSIAQTYI